MAIDNGNPSATVAATTIASSSRTVVPPTEKPEKFSGKFTIKKPLVLVADMPDNEKFMIVEAWKQEDFLCKGYMLSSLEDDLYNVYSAMNTSKELWDALEKKYKTEDACLKKFVVAKFLDYKMIDNKTMGTQVQVLQLIFHDLIAEGMVMNEAFQVAPMIEKLHPSWKDFKNYLKHKRKEMKLEDLVIRLKIEEDNKTVEKKSRGNSTIMGSNLVEETAPKVRRRGLLDRLRSRTKINSRETATIVKTLDKKKGQANIVEKNDDIDDLCAMLSEYNLVGNSNEWWIDSGATRNVCAIKEAFATYSTIGPEEEISMGNNATTKIESYGKIFLKMTSGKVLTINNVLHVPTIRKNLVFTYLLVKNRFTCDEAIETFTQYKNEVENQLNKKIKMIRSDRGGEYESPFAEICS
uniref:Retrovirus-related Pol polyprotein from transposon TNT 1-94-like beta-barrel domain-containing protein n=1 Tax=Nicotiana tabacum TaxID=4097 RepID=A0A1S4BS18_TOBAC